jgi:hypothetical protein
MDEEVVPLLYVEDAPRAVARVRASRVEKGLPGGSATS